MAAKKKNARKKAPPACHGYDGRDGDEHAHPDHSYALPRLRRIGGQISGLEAMITDRRYCVDILIQFRAALAALRNLEAELFETHLRHCVTQAIRSRDTEAADQKIRELTELLARRTQA